ncbi:3-oxo-5a-steroid 4- dehydrogenase [Cystobasidiomycetes sp. EMM_F5]
MPPVPASARPLKLTINSRGKSSQPITVSLPGDATSSELFKQVAAKTRLNINRIRLTTADKKTVLVNDAKKTLTDANLHDGDALIYKDLGLQMSYRGVYLLEYFGPLFIHPLFFFYGHQILYRFLPSPYNTVGPFTHSKMQL